MQKIGKDWQEFLKYSVELFDYAIVDPPWKYKDIPPKVEGQLNFTLWTSNNLFEKLLSQLRAKYIFIWTTNSMLEIVIPALSKSEFYDYKTILTWLKTTKNGKKVFGMGNTFRGCTEFLVVAYRKKMTPIKCQIRSFFEGESKLNTQKPRKLEKEIIEHLDSINLKKGLYLFSGIEDFEDFNNFDLTLVDIKWGKDENK